MRTTVLFMRTLAVIAAASFAAPIQTKAGGGPTVAQVIAAVRAYAPRAMAEQGTPGLSVAITDRTHTLAIITLGYANRDAKTPVTPQTRFAIGSITKSMSSLALLQLRDEGRINLDASVTRYLPWFSIGSGGKPILVHELLSHTAGIPDDYSVSPSYGYSIEVLREAHTLFAPGTSWSYSNDGYAIVGAIVAALDRDTWASSLQARVLNPIGMTSTSPVFTPRVMMTDTAVGYEYRDADRPPSLHPPLVPSRPFDFVDPAGSVLSTPGDMARYLRVFLNGGVTPSGRRLISRASFAAMTSPDRYLNGKPAGSATVLLPEAPQYYKKYGYGLSIFNDRGDHLIGHTGGISGFTACMQANLTRGFGVIAMANLVEEPLHPCAIVLYAMKVLRAQSLGQPLPAPPSAPNPAFVANGTDYAGTYSSLGGTRVQIDGTHGGVAMIDHGAAYTLYPRGTDLFWSPDPRYALFLLHFDRNKEKRVIDFTYGSQYYANERFARPRTWRYPAAWNAYVGRYENAFWGSPQVTRVLVVKGTLTFDGLQPLVPAGTATFKSGPDVVKFDALAGGKAQRMTIDASHLYRVELP
jgi:D-alanyl-D-alanine carboxypeptidase